MTELEDYLAKWRKQTEKDDKLKWFFGDACCGNPVHIYDRVEAGR